jgi:ABC-type lipoprotein export system ATPase subunit
VLLGNEIGKLGPGERDALQKRFAVLPAEGGLISHLNAWENIVLPLGFHKPQRVAESLPQVEALLAGFGETPRALLAKLPEEMSLYEKKLTGYVRILLEAPELVLAVDLAGGLESAERGRIAGCPAAYHAARAGGTFVEFTDPSVD